MNFQKAPVLVVGQEITSFSAVVCLLQAGHPVTLITPDRSGARNAIDAHGSFSGSAVMAVPDRGDFEIREALDRPLDVPLVIVMTAEDLQVKRAVIERVTRFVPEAALIAVNTESIALSAIQKDAVRPERIIGANWSEPVHTTFFLEVISNDETAADLVDTFVSTARAYWQKDPYVIEKDTGIRARMMSAMVREAFFLLENDYVTIEDIDRACRNDPGYYLPFAGHCRYMDLMGAYVYAVVMKDLNPELSKDSSIPPFFTRIIAEGGEGFKNGKGFYHYEPHEVERRMDEFRKFSFKMRDIIAKYPFSALKKNLPTRKKVVSEI